MCPSFFLIKYSCGTKGDPGWARRKSDQAKMTRGRGVKFISAIAVQHMHGTPQANRHSANQLYQSELLYPRKGARSGK